MSQLLKQRPALWTRWMNLTCAAAFPSLRSTRVQSCGRTGKFLSLLIFVGVIDNSLLTAEAYAAT